MTLGQLFESGIVIEGYRKIQCWENEDNATIYYEGYDSGDMEKYYDRKISYIFSYSLELNETAICIELEEI